MVIELWGGPKDGERLDLTISECRDVLEFMVVDIDFGLVGKKVEEDLSPDCLEYRTRVAYYRTGFHKDDGTIRYDYRS